MGDRAARIPAAVELPGPSPNPLVYFGRNADGIRPHPPTRSVSRCCAWTANPGSLPAALRCGGGGGGSAGTVSGTGRLSLLMARTARKIASAMMRKSRIVCTKSPYFSNTGTPLGSVPIRRAKSAKFTPPVSTPTTGMIRSPTSDETIFPNAPPTTTPTARSMTLPRMANSLNSDAIVMLPPRKLRSSGKLYLICRPVGLCVGKGKTAGAAYAVRPRTPRAGNGRRRGGNTWLVKVPGSRRQSQDWTVWFSVTRSTKPP